MATKSVTTATKKAETVAKTAAAAKAETASKTVATAGTKETGVNPVNVKADTAKTAAPAKKAAPKASPVKKAEPDKTTAAAAKKAPAKKAPAKKAPVKKTAAKKEMKVKAYVEYFGRQIEEAEMLAAVKKAWTKTGGKVGDIKTVELYIKPEENAVYYVINGTETGAVPFSV